MTDQELDQALERVRSQADELGIKYHHRAGVKKIQSLIDAHLAQGNIGEALEKSEPNVINVAPNSEKVEPMAAADYQKLAKEEAKRKAASLVRVRVTCMNQQKKDWNGEIISVGSAKLGTFKRFVPFHGVEWHIPKIIYDMMKERKCSTFVNGTDGRGHPTKEPRQINEFSIQVLPPLTPDELSDLARKQAAAAGQG